jgi:DTW domain-containing protein YfiP
MIDILETFSMPCPHRRSRLFMIEATWRNVRQMFRRHLPKLSAICTDATSNHTNETPIFPKFYENNSDG